MANKVWPKSVMDSRDQVEFEGMPDYQVLLSKMGGYRFWVLEAATYCGVNAPWIRMENYDIGRDTPNTLKGLLKYLDSRKDEIFVAWVYNHKLSIVLANFSMQDIGYRIAVDEFGNEWSLDVTKAHLRVFMGMAEAYGPIELPQRAHATLSNAEHLKTQIESGPLVDLFANNDKTTKRIKNCGRPFRFIHTLNRPLVIKLVGGVDPKPHRDGILAMRRELYELAVDNCELPSYDEVHGEIIRQWAMEQPINNFRMEGEAVLDETSDTEIIEQLSVDGKMDADTWQLFAKAKGNAIVTDVPPGEDWDLMMSVQCLGFETFGDGGYSMVMVDPQGVKDAYADAQTVMNHPFMLAKGFVDDIMVQESSKTFHDIAMGERYSNIRDLASAEFSTRGGWDERRYEETFRWAITIAAVHGIDYRDSPWAIKQIGQTWVDGLRLKDKRQIRLPLPCAKRAQVLSRTGALYRQGLQLPELGHREYTWVPSLGALVVNDDDFDNIVFLLHGDPDQDDFYVNQQRTLTDDHVNAGESFNAGEKVMLITRNPNHRGEYSLWHHRDTAEESTWVYETGKHAENQTFPPLSRNQWPTDILTAQGLSMPTLAGNCVTLHPKETVIKPLPSEEPNSAAGPDADRAFAWKWRSWVLGRLLKEQKAGRRVDKVIARRVGLGKRLRGDPTKHMSTQLTVMRGRAKEFRQNIKALANDTTPADSLTEVVKTFPDDVREYAAGLLSDSRSIIAEMNEQNRYSGEELDGAAIRNAQTPLFVDALGDIHPARRGAILLSLWYSALTTPTTRGDISDQPVWGLPTVRDWMMEAYVYYGLTGEPTVTDDGRLTRDEIVRFDNGVWHCTCTNCSTVKTTSKLKVLAWFHDHGNLCPDCNAQAGAEG